MDENCSLCFYSEEKSELTELMQKYSNKQYFKCIHPNSPFYENLVTEDESCRLFMNEKEYFDMKDRKEQLEKLKDKIKGKRK